MENFKKKGGTLKCLFVLIGTIMFATVSKAQPSINLIPVITENLVSPIQFVHAGDGSNRIFIVERAGVIKAFGGALVDGSYPFLGTYLDITAKVNTSGEGGLLSIAFHPDYAVEGEIRVYFLLTTPIGQHLTVILSSKNIKLRLRLPTRPFLYRRILF